MFFIFSLFILCYVFRIINLLLFLVSVVLFLFANNYCQVVIFVIWLECCVVCRSRIYYWKNNFYHAVLLVMFMTFSRKFLNGSTTQLFFIRFFHNWWYVWNKVTFILICKILFFKNNNLSPSFCSVCYKLCIVFVTSIWLLGFA